MQHGFGLDSITQVSNVESRSISPENPEGEVGAGGQAESYLGPSRKGQPCIPLDEDETMTVADIDGPGVIRHIWFTGITPDATTDAGDAAWRDVTLRMYWDGEDEPSVEVPVADFFCNGMGVRSTVDSVPVVVAPASGFNSYWPLPFREHAKITLESDHPIDLPGIYYQVDYTSGDELSEDTAYFHAQWRRENPTTKGEDFTIVDGIEGNGHYVGTYLAWTALSDGWWGEGEVKFYVDGDDEYPTICGTGAEDYPGGAWGFLGEDENGESRPRRTRRRSSATRSVTGDQVFTTGLRATGSTGGISPIPSTSRRTSGLPSSRSARNTGRCTSGRTTSLRSHTGISTNPTRRSLNIRTERDVDRAKNHDQD